MKKSELRQLIKEEIQKILNEDLDPFKVIGKHVIVKKGFGYAVYDPYMRFKRAVSNMKGVIDQFNNYQSVWIELEDGSKIEAPSVSLKIVGDWAKHRALV